MVNKIWNTLTWQIMLLRDPSPTQWHTKINQPRRNLKKSSIANEMVVRLKSYKSANDSWHN